MTTVPNVSVDATWRMARFEFNTPAQVDAGMVYGYSEVLLQEPAMPTKGAEFMNVRSPLRLPQQQDETGKKTYGSMPGAMINRNIAIVADETVEVGSKVLSFTELMQACNAFFEKWRVEDETQPKSMTPPPMPPPDTVEGQAVDDPTTLQKPA
jgi:hypothetical protein